MLLTACGGGGGGSGSSAKINIVRSGVLVDNTSSDNGSIVISQADNKSITLHWQVNSNEPYNMFIYLSDDNQLNRSDSDELIAAYENLTKDNVTVTIDPTSDAYKKISNAYGGKHYLIFDANVSFYHSIVSVPVILKKIWTVAVYMDGDNSLSDAVSTNMNWMEEVGSTKDVNIVVETDTSSETTHRYFIKKNSSVLIADLGELDMADNKTLVDFGRWVINNYPAAHYMLILWNHGLGFRSIGNNRDIFWDDNTGGSPAGSPMSIPALKSALLGIKNILKRKIDIIGFDACLMGMVEIAYEIKDSAHIMIASENTEPFDGWPYNDFLAYLVNHPLSPEDNISTAVVKDYITHYGSNGTETLSAINLDSIDYLCSAFDNLSKALLSDNDSITLFKNSIVPNVQRLDENADNSIESYDSYVDMIDMVRRIINDNGFSQFVRDNASVVNSIFDNSTIIENKKGSGVPNAFGLSIWLPDNTAFSSTYYQNKYRVLDFYKDFKWYNFLQKLNQ